MFTSKSPFVWLSISLTCCALALGLIPQLRSDAVLSTAEEAIEEVPEVPDAIYTAMYSRSPDDRGVYMIVDQMPLFPGGDCGDITDYEERGYCSSQALRRYIDENVSYPEEAKEEGITGSALVSFIVEPHGAITEIGWIINPEDRGLGKAAAKVVEKMKEDGLRWEPGLHEGKPVRVAQYLSVPFKLE